MAGTGSLKPIFTMNYSITGQSERIVGGFGLAEFRNVLHSKIDSLFVLQIWV